MYVLFKNSLEAVFYNFFLRIWKKGLPKCATEPSPNCCNSGRYGDASIAHLNKPPKQALANE